MNEAVLLVLGLAQPVGLLATVVGSILTRYHRVSTWMMRGGAIGFLTGVAGMAGYAKWLGWI